MPKLACLCGFVHDLSKIPDDGFVVVADVLYERLVVAECERFEQSRKVDAITGRVSELDRTVGSVHSRMYECRQCGRLAWPKKDGAGIVFYRREPPS